MSVADHDLIVIGGGPAGEKGLPRLPISARGWRWSMPTKNFQVSESQRAYAEPA